MLSLSIFGFTQVINPKADKELSYDTILEELKSSPYWFVDHAKLRKSKKDEYYKFNDTSLGLDLFEHYVLGEIENYYFFNFKISFFLYGLFYLFLP